ncbi:MAG: redox-sensing transcriptional repressor Rex [Pseudoflavonifractor sp.]|nr:redox-sensing transcriptional repressor Rex [Alloprevotella sp.]MCM1116282.1 redox-sensing transcriptional repressor Rex [Pseudoflavonifractor sp.]
MTAHFTSDIIPEPTLRRLPWYLAYLSMLKQEGVEHISSTAIARELNVDPSQTAKDLSFLHIKGRTRVGYEVAILERKLRDFLGFEVSHPAVMIGCGSLGRALMADSGLAHYGLRVVAGFDTDPSLAGQEIGGVTIHPMTSLEEKRRALGAEIAIIAVPVGQAQRAADHAVAAGIKALWNFTPFRIRTREDIVIQNTSIYSHLAVMYNRLATLHSSTPRR